MRRITALWESFFSKSLYSDAFYSWGGIGFLTLLLIALIHTLAIFGIMQVGIQKFIRTEVPPIVAQVPSITFKDGKAITPEAKEYRITAPKGELIAIIDTRVPHPPADLNGVPIYVAGESATMKKSDSEQRTYDYMSMEGITVDQKLINYWLDFAVAWLAVICSPFIFGFYVIWFLVQLLVFSLVTLIVSNSKDLRGSYAATLRLTAMAMVPALVVETIFSLSSIGFFGISLLTSAIVIGYIFFGVNAAKESAEPEHPDLPPPLV